MCTRIAAHRGARAFGVDSVPERLAITRRHGFEAIDDNGRGADSGIDAVGMEAHGSPGAEPARKIATALPDSLAGPMMSKAGVDRLAALYSCTGAVRRGGTLSGAYGGMADPMPMTTLFDQGVRIAMGQAHVRRWIDDVLPLVNDETDPLGVRDLATHRMPLQRAAQGYEQFQYETDGTIKVLLQTEQRGHP